MIQKIFLTVLCSLISSFSLSAALSFDEAIIPSKIQTVLHTKMKSIKREFLHATKKTKGEVLNMLIIPFFISIDAIETMEESVASELEKYTQSISPEAKTILTKIRALVTTVGESFMSEVSALFEDNTSNIEEVDVDSIILKTTAFEVQAPLIIYEELYQALTEAEQESLRSIFDLKGELQITKKSSTNSVIPTPQELFDKTSEIINTRVEYYKNGMAQMIQQAEQLEKQQKNKKGSKK